MTRTFFATALMAASALAGIAASPAALASSADYFRERLGNSSVPRQLGDDDRVYYGKLFGAIRSEDWAGAEAMLAGRPEGPLHAVARAELYLAARSPKVPMGPLLGLLAEAPELPHAERLKKLAVTRGATFLPDGPAVRQLSWQGGVSRRVKPRAVEDGTMAAATAQAILARIKVDDAPGARALLEAALPGLSVPARTEWQQRVAWSHFIENDDAGAIALAREAVRGEGAWLAESWWVLGLASWRSGDCEQASRAFSETARRADNAELRTAGHFWASRAQLRCRRPAEVAAALKAAAAEDETLYGMLAAEALGMRMPERAGLSDFTGDDWKAAARSRNVAAAVALTEIGESDLADELLRHQARIGPADGHGALSRLARELSLPGAQLYLAHNAPAGATVEEFARYPAPRWSPANGWRVDPALAYAHTLQESNFRARVTSPAGARGLMQVMPGTARLMATRTGIAGAESRLDDPAVNLELGQSYLETLRDMAETGGLLPKVMAAYNAGPTPIGRWNSEVRDGGDPLLWMESIPYWETRGYVATVMRNYWMYERQARAGSNSRVALAQGLWPRFPGLADDRPVRLTPPPGTGKDRGKGLAHAD